LKTSVAIWGTALYHVNIKKSLKGRYWRERETAHKLPRSKKNPQCTVNVLSQVVTVVKYFDEPLDHVVCCIPSQDAQCCEKLHSCKAEEWVGRYRDILREIDCCPRKKKVSCILLRLDGLMEKCILS
jgi:hypothetical protein